jgi:uncharacterized membrane protein
MNNEMQEAVESLTLAVSHAAEAVAAAFIGFALINVIYQYVRLLCKRTGITQKFIRLQFGSVVAVALELMLGADVLATAVAPGWDDIGKLGAIAIIRTALNYFLAKELHEAKSTLQA